MDRVDQGPEPNRTRNFSDVLGEKSISLAARSAPRPGSTIFYFSALSMPNACSFMPRLSLDAIADPDMDCMLSTGDEADPLSLG